MKTIQYTIGDWVQRKDGTYARIDGITTNPFGEYFLTFENLYVIDNINDVSPIPIIEGILHENALTSVKTKLYTSYLLFCIDKGIDYYPMQGYVEVWFDNDDTFHFHSNINDGYSIDGKMYYVHELLHALRLCGLEELADNFKLNAE